MTYKEFCIKCYEGLPEDEILPKGTKAQEGLEILIDHFLGYLPIIKYPGSQEQWNSEAIAEVLEKYLPGKIRKIPKN